MIHDPIYKRDTAGRLRVWYIEQDGARYRVHSGLNDGTLAVTGWTVAVGKQGRSDQAQADAEIASAYENKLTREYHRTIEATDGGAHFFKPMLAKEYKGWDPSWSEVVVQPKLDGIRCITTKAGMFSRQGKPITAVPHIHAALSGLFETYPGLVLDGELYNHEFKDDFNTIVSIVRKKDPTVEELELAEAKIQYHVYDVPSNNADCTKLRLSMLHDHDLRGIIELVPTSKPVDADAADLLYAEYLEQGYEGQMVRLPGKYEQKRSSLLLKRKEFQDAEFEIVSIEEGVGNWAGVAKAVRCRLPDGRIFGAGIRGTRERAAELLGETHKVATVRFFALTPDGIPRFPVVTKFHGVERTL